MEFEWISILELNMGGKLGRGVPWLRWSNTHIIALHDSWELFKHYHYPASLLFNSRHFSHQMNLHDDVIKWKPFPRYWPFVPGIHQSPVNSPHKGQWRGALMFFWCFSFDLRLNKRLSKQSCGWWFEIPSRSLWRHCNGNFSPCIITFPTAWKR